MATPRMYMITPVAGSEDDIAAYTAAELLDPTTAVPAQSAWQQVCVVDASLSRTWGEEDVTDTCTGDFDAAIQTTRALELTFNAFKKRVAGALPAWLTSLLGAAKGQIFWFLIVDDDQTVSGTHGFWMIGHVFGEDYAQPLRGGISFDFTAKGAGTISGVDLSGQYLAP